MTKKYIRESVVTTISRISIGHSIRYTRLGEFSYRKGFREKNIGFSLYSDPHQRVRFFIHGAV
jgi:hypothetical protein